jgi:hypothetical protein
VHSFVTLFSFAVPNPLNSFVPPRSLREAFLLNHNIDKNGQKVMFFVKLGAFFSRFSGQVVLKYFLPLALNNK